MQSDQDAAEDATPEIDAHRNRRDQDRDPGRLLQLGRDDEDMREYDRQNQAGSDNGQTDPEAYPQRAGDRLTGFFVVILGDALGDEARDRAAKSQVEQTHV